MYRILKDDADVSAFASNKKKGKDARIFKSFPSLFGVTINLIVRPDTRKHALFVDLTATNDNDIDISASEYLGKIESLTRILNGRNKTDAFTEAIGEILAWADANVFDIYCLPLYRWKVWLRNGWASVAAENRAVAERMVKDKAKACGATTKCVRFEKKEMVTLRHCGQVGLYLHCYR